MISGEERGHPGLRILPSCGSSLLLLLFPPRSVIVGRRVDRNWGHSSGSSLGEGMHLPPCVSCCSVATARVMEGGNMTSHVPGRKGNVWTTHREGSTNVRKPRKYSLLGQGVGDEQALLI